jgi:streptogramin lyase
LAGIPQAARAQVAIPAQVDEATAVYDGFKLEYYVPGAPRNVAAEAAGKVWFTSPDADGIGLVEVLSGLDAGLVRYRVTFYATGRNSMPYDLVYRGGVVWFSLRDSAQIGRMDTATRELTLIDMPTRDDHPTGIDFGDNRVWIGTVEGVMVAFDPTTGTFQSFTEWANLPPRHPRIEDVLFMGVREIWFSLPDEASIGQLNSVGERFFNSPTPAFRPIGLAGDGRSPWVAAKGDPEAARIEEEKQAAGDPNANPALYYGKILKLSGDTRGDWVAFDAPNRFGSPAGIVVVPGPKGNEIWFTEMDNGTVSRFRFYPNQPGTPVRETSQLAASGARPFGITKGPDLHLWVADGGRGVIYELTPPYIFKQYFPIVP